MLQIFDSVGNVTSHSKINGAVKSVTKIKHFIYTNIYIFVSFIFFLLKSAAIDYRQSHYVR